MAKRNKPDKAFTDFDAYERSIASVTNNFKAQDEFLKEIQKKMETTKGVISSIGDVLQNNNDLTEAQKDAITDSVKQYKQQQIDIARARIEQKKGNMAQEEYNKLVMKGQEAYRDLVKSISASGQSAKAIIPILKTMGDEMESFNKAASRSQKALDGMNMALDHIGGSGVAGVRELGDVIKSAAQGGKGLTLALGALGAALGALAYNYGLLGDKVGTTAEFDKGIAETSGAIDVLEKQIAAGKFGGRNFVQEKAMAQFASSMRSAAASFQAAAKTALFGNSIGGVGYGAAQLQMAGIGADKIAAGMTAAADATGQMPTGKMGADMAIMAARTGQSEQSIANINEAFMRMDGVSASTALNMQEGLRSMAKQANINLGGLMTEMAEASKDMLGYQIKSGSALAKQVTFARSMGVSFQDIAKAGQSMVLNYKDSIKSEMQLSAMLGKNVDLSEVRSAFASGDTEGALKALKAQGLDPASMDMFQQQQLQQATGMDLTTLSKISTKQGKEVGGLQAGNAGAGNQGFLSKTVAAQASLEATNASISSDTAIQMSKLDTAEQMQLQQAIKDNTGGINGLKVSLSQQEALKDATLGLTTAIFSLIGSLALMGAGQLFKGKMPGLGKLNPFSKAAPKIPPPTGPLTKAGVPDMRYTANKVPGASIADDVVKSGSKSSKLASMLPKIGKFAKGLGVVGTVLGAGFDFKNRKDEGQTNTQAVAGTAGGVGGALAGAAAGAAIGSVVPIVGTAIGGIIGGALGAWGGGSLADLITGVGKKSEVKAETKVQAKETAKVQEKAAATTTPATAGTTSAKPGSTSVTTAISNSEKWIQDKLTYMSGNLERVVDRTTKTMINTAATTTELKTLNTNTKALVNLTTRIEALTAATYQGKGNVELKLDGKTVAYSFNKYKENTINTNPSPTGGPNQ
jgi:hypothetical protein